MHGVHVEERQYMMGKRAMNAYNECQQQNLVKFERKTVKIYHYAPERNKYVIFSKNGDFA